MNFQFDSAPIRGENSNSISFGDTPRLHSGKVHFSSYQKTQRSALYAGYSFSRELLTYGPDKLTKNTNQSQHESLI